MSFSSVYALKRKISTTLWQEKEEDQNNKKVIETEDKTISLNTSSRSNSNTFSNPSKNSNEREEKMNKFILINTDQNLEDKIFRVDKRTKLTLKPGPKCLALNLKIKTNFPLELKNKKFSRKTYYDLPIALDHQDLISSTFNWSATIQLDLAGTFHFICYQNLTDNDDESLEFKIIWQAYIIVNPEIKIPLNSIKCQTVLTKQLGLFKDWRKRLLLSKDLKYNVLHFTPIQQLGASQSAYSLSNQNKVNPNFKATFDDIKREIDFIDKKWSMLSITDIVLNHTADDSEWIHEHPECGYNLNNSPHLRPAFLLDCAFIWLSQDMVNGLLAKTDLLSEYITTELDVQKVGILLKTFYVPQLKLYELFMINMEFALDNFDKIERGGARLQVDYGVFERNQAKLSKIPHTIKSLGQLKQLIIDENMRKRCELRDLLDYAVNNALNAIRYERLNPNGPYFNKPISNTCPLVAPYFNHSQPLERFNINEEEGLIYSAGQQFMAHNGWVMGVSAGELGNFEDFASANSRQVYLQRELVAWGDCIKLRYGQGPEDVPYLWDFMRKYVESQAKIFHGFRIDNCHSTPLHVAEYFIDCARQIRPDIYIMAELFTSSESSDNIYVNRLGITSLIRESMSAHNARELGRLMYRFGGTPVGAFYQLGQAEHLIPSIAHAIFYDQTHDNESPIVCRSAYDVPATTSIISMASCAIGSVRGYDELVPHHINVVSENRLYQEYSDDGKENENKSDNNQQQLTATSGILPLRKMLNGQLQRELDQGFDEIFIDQNNDEVLAITRHNPHDGRSIVLVARTSFSKQPGPCYIKPIPIQGKIARILFEAQAFGDPDQYERNEQYINGLSSFKIKIFNSNAIDLEQSKLAKLVNYPAEDRAELLFNEYQFLSSSVLAVEIHLSDRQSKALATINNWQIEPQLQQSITLNDANYILFRCANEDGLEPYELPNFKKFTYSGLYGLMHYLEVVRDNQDQAHPLAMNLRAGAWLSEYIVNRLHCRPSTRLLAENLDFILKQVDLLPRGMVPKYFDLIVTKLYNSLLEKVYSSMSIFISKGPRLVKLLALSSIALVGECQSSPMPPIELSSMKLNYLPSIAAGLPHFASGYMRNWGRDTYIAMRGLLLITGRFVEAKAIILSYARTLKNGLIPNLLDGGIRSRYNCRDAIWWWLYSIREYTKLAPNGAEILRCKVARIHRPHVSASLLNKANMSSSASSSSSHHHQQQMRKRSVISQQTNGLINLSTSDDGDSFCCIQPLSDIIQEAMECHFEGMEFIEENAGKQLDEHMKEEGFTITYGVNRETGFVFGGNKYNCGTWMDKMGSSEKAGTKGFPASPRDGSAVEIIGLCKAVVSWLDEMCRTNNRSYPYDGVECLYDNTITLKWTWKKWSTMLQVNFEKYFYIPLEEEEQQQQQQQQEKCTHSNEQQQVDPNVSLINRRGIYKDTYNATLAWQDYQLRPNFLITMVVAPELFDRKHAKHALKLVKEHLCGPLGMKTLDPSDWNYRGDYDNGNDTDDPKVAHGYNYHQGPEWLWLTGYYIRASSKFLGSAEREHHMKLLSNFYAALVDTPWLGLPELTNSNGKFCPGSCPIQAWSLGTALEALHESVRNQ